MANDKFRRCAFIVNLFKHRPKLTQKEIGEALKEAFPYDRDLTIRTFERYKEFIEENFTCKLVFDQRIKKYHLQKDVSAKEDNSVFEYLTSMYDVLGSEPLFIKHQSKIHNAEIITGTDKLDLILRAIEEKRGYTCEYFSFNNNTKKKRTYIPLFLTSWEGRWYVVANVTTHPDGTPCTYALERMKDIELTEEHMMPYSKVTIKEYFKDSYGIQHHSPEDQPQDILIKATGSQVQYIKARPIHKSQKVIEEGEGYCIIKLHLTPCFNFYQQLLWHRETIEVLEPTCVREELKCIVKKLCNIYK